MVSSSISTSESFNVSSPVEDSITFVSDSDHHCQRGKLLPLTSSNLEILQMTCQVHAKHHYILSYVKNQISILAMEAKLQHQRWREIQTLVPLEATPLEKETIICCVDNEDRTTTGSASKYDINSRQKEKHPSTDEAKLETPPKLQKRHSWMFPKRRRQRCHHHHSISYSTQQHTSSTVHQKQKYEQEKMDLIRLGLCGSSSSIMLPASATTIEDHCQPNQLASILFSSLISSCTSRNSLTSSSFSIFDPQRFSTTDRGEPFTIENIPTIKRRFSNPARLQNEKQLSPTPSHVANEEQSSRTYWWKRYRVKNKQVDTKSNCCNNSTKICHHHNTQHDYADFLAFRYPKMIPFHRLRDTALQVLLSPDQQRQQHVEHSSSLLSFPSSSRISSPLPFPSS